MKWAITLHVDLPDEEPPEAWTANFLKDNRGTGIEYVMIDAVDEPIEDDERAHLIERGHVHQMSPQPGDSTDEYLQRVRRVDRARLAAGIPDGEGLRPKR